MSKIFENAFKGGKALVTFVTCGDPTIAETESRIRALVEGGADIIELGIPFSDPAGAEPVIEAATKRALKSGTTTDSVFEMVERLRKDVTTPFLFMAYANMVFSYGAERFIERCAKLDVRGLVLPDVPYEERGEFEEICDKYGVALIRFVAPTSGQRIPMIARGAKGFIYAYSTFEGVPEGDAPLGLTEMVAAVREVTDTPVVVDCGISTLNEAKLAGTVADGIIVSGALVRLANDLGEKAPKGLAAYARGMKEAVA